MCWFVSMLGQSYVVVCVYVRSVICGGLYLRPVSDMWWLVFTSGQ